MVYADTENDFIAKPAEAEGPDDSYFPDPVEVDPNAPDDIINGVDDGPSGGGGGTPPDNTSPDDDNNDPNTDPVDPAEEPPDNTGVEPPDGGEEEDPDVEPPDTDDGDAFIPPPADGAEIKDPTTPATGSVNTTEPDMSASVADAADVELPESNTGFENLTEDDYLVENRLEELYDRDSPFMEKARQQAQRRHLAAGGQNSLMAGMAGEGAAMEVAYKTAFADAKTMAAFAEGEQRFIHNALLSDQAYGQARELQSQRVEAQFEAIRLDFKGKSHLMDKELDQWFQQAAKQHEYAIDMMWEQETAFEGREQRGFARKMTLEGMLSMSEFYTSSVSAVMAATANLKNADQQRVSMENGMQWASRQFDLLQGFWGQWGAGGPPDTSSTATTDWMGNYDDSANPYQNWWDFQAGIGG